VSGRRPEAADTAEMTSRLVNPIGAPESTSPTTTAASPARTRCRSLHRQGTPGAWSRGGSAARPVRPPAPAAGPGVGHRGPPPSASSTAPRPPARTGQPAGPGGPAQRVDGQAGAPATTAARSSSGATGTADHRRAADATSIGTSIAAAGAGMRWCWVWAQRCGGHGRPSRAGREWDAAPPQHGVEGSRRDGNGTGGSPSRRGHYRSVGTMPAGGTVDHCSWRHENDHARTVELDPLRTHQHECRRTARHDIRAVGHHDNPGR
jgi:hypothetical protein